MAKFTPIMIGLLLTAAFSYAVFFGGIMMQSQNNAPILFIGDSENNQFYQQINETLYDASTDAAIAQGAFENSSIQTSGVVPFVSALGGIWKVLRNAPITVYNLVITYGLGKLFGNEAALAIVSIVGAVITIILISAIILYVSRGEGG